MPERCGTLFSSLLCVCYLWILLWVYVGVGLCFRCFGLVYCG